jgi:adenylyl-sulfate kinase
MRLPGRALAGLSAALRQNPGDPRTPPCPQCLADGESSAVALPVKDLRYLGFAADREALDIDMTDARHDVFPQPLRLAPASRSALMKQHPCVVWLTGLPGAGKTTIANALELRLHALGHYTYTLDGDNLRGGLNSDLGFGLDDRRENIRRAAEVAGLMADAGLIVLAAFISPLRADRAFARSRLARARFLEVYVRVPLAVAEARDPKGLYRKARRGEIPHFTGIDSPYEEPENAEIVVDTSRLTVDEAVLCVIDELRRRGICVGRMK